jgi:hypothetical protein
MLELGWADDQLLGLITGYYVDQEGTDLTDDGVMTTAAAFQLGDYYPVIHATVMSIWMQRNSQLIEAVNPGYSQRKVIDITPQ